MKQLVLIVSVVFAGFLQNNAQTQFSSWVKHIEGVESSAFNNIVFDGTDIIANGYWFLDATFEDVELPYFTSTNALLVKMDTSGNLKWHTIMTGDGYETFFDMAVDSEKNIVVTGWSSSNQPIAINGETVFVPEMEWISRGVVAKFSGADGSLIWYKTFFSEQEYSGVNSTRLSVDNQDNIYIMGYYDSTFKIDTFSVSFNQPNYGNSPFVAKFDSDGNTKWVKSFDFVDEGYGGFITPRAMKSSETDLYLGFEYSKPLIVNNEELSYSGEYYWNAVMKMSLADGSVSKVKTFGSVLGQGIKSLKLDSQGNVVVGGFFYANSDFKVDNETLNGYGETDGFIAKFDPQLNLLWLREMGGDFSDQLFNITIDSNNKIYLGGGFDCYTPFNYEDVEVLPSKNPNSLSLFQLVLDKDGNVEHSYSIYAENIFGRLDYRDAALVRANLLFVVGSSVDSILFIENNMFFSEHDAAFLIRWDFSDITNITNPHSPGKISVFPNPSSDKITITGCNGIQSVEVVNMQGQIVKNSLNVISTNEISISDLDAGVYLVRIITDKGSQTQKIQILK